MKLVVYLFIFIALPFVLFAQQPDSVLIKKDSLKKDSLKTIAPKIDSAKIDSLRKDSVKIDSIKKDSIRQLLPLYTASLQKVLKDNKHLNFTGRPFGMAVYEKKQVPQDSIFLSLLTIIALLAFFRFFYVRYFNNLFRVFFNTSLRQSQLTDQLLQAKLPSLFFNIVFVASGGLFIYLLLKYLGWISGDNPVIVILLCSLCLAIIYMLKFISLKFTGWVTGFKEVTNTYIFIIFLINKILGILLLPFIVVMAFSTPVLIKVSALIAVLLTTVMFLMRFYRSYGLLQNQLKISRIHFLMYIAGVEIVPVLLIYKGLVLLLQRS